jgi:methylisocitrate lyase
MKSNKAKALREVIAKSDFFVLPGIYDCLGAQMAQNNGFEAVYLSGGAMSMAVLGKPDMGFLNLTDLKTNLQHIISSTDLAVISDTDNGFGNAIHAVDTAKALFDMGVAGLQIDDNISPSPVPQDSKELIPWEQLAPKILGIREAVGEDFIIILRTIIGISKPMDEIIERVDAAKAVGVDFVFVDGIKSVQDLAYLNHHTGAELIINLNENGFAASLSIEEIKAMGYRFGLYPVSTLQLSAGIYDKFFSLLKAEKSSMKMVGQMFPAPKLQNVFGKERLVKKYQTYYK